ncbi:hypothetical protein OC842_001289 [Tilletia horrida]|uniref:C2H2-type domain-containing protein n=1 Tax=Tilletia horrida TaxID=155126 RepID=A0AAN6JM51_9BASI|nr:hypothetical protein OC842_001289 [Tilletia horrida]
MDWVLFDDSAKQGQQQQQANTLAAAPAAPLLGANPEIPVAGLGSNGLMGPDSGPGPGTGGATNPTGTSGAGAGAALAVMAAQAQAQGLGSGNAQAQGEGQPLALSGFGAYRQPADPLATPTPQQLASMVASEHASQRQQAAAAAAAVAVAQAQAQAQTRAGSGGVGFGGAGMAATLSGQGQRMAAEQTSPFMGANAPLPLGEGCDSMPLFPSSAGFASGTGTGTGMGAARTPRQSSLNSTCGSNEVSSMDVFNGSPVNPPSGSFGPPIQNLSLGGGTGKSASSLRSDSVDSFIDGPLFPSSSLASSATTPSATSMQASNSNMTITSADGSKAGQAGTRAGPGNSAADSLFTMAQQQEEQNQVSAGSAPWPTTAQSLSKDEESDLLSTPKAREQPISASGSWTKLLVNGASSGSGAAVAVGAGGGLGTGKVGLTSGAPDMGTPSTMLPLSLGGGFFPAPATAGNAIPAVQPVPLNPEALSAALAASNGGAGGALRRPALRGPSAANASAGNSASSGLSLFAASESSTLDEDEDEGGLGANADEDMKPAPPTALQALANGMGMDSTMSNGPGFGGAKGTDGSAGRTIKRQQPTQLSLLASSALFNGADGHDAPRFAAIDQAGTSESDDERELEESIRRRRQQQHLLRQQGLLLDPLVHGPNPSSSSSSISIPGSGESGRGGKIEGKDGAANGASDYLGVHPSFSRRSSASTSEDDSLMSPPIRDSAESADHFGATTSAAQRTVATNFRSQANRGGGGGGKGKTGAPGQPPSRTTGAAGGRGSAAGTKAAAPVDEDEDDDDEDEDDAEDEDEEDEFEDDDYAEAGGHASGSGRGRGAGSSRGRNTRTSRSAGSAALSGSGAAPAQKRRKRASPKADEPVNISTLGGSHTTSTGLTVCDYISPLVMMGLPTEGAGAAAAIKEARCGTVFHRPYDLSRHRETIHAREEARLVKAGQLKVEDCVVMGKEITAEKVMAGATEWKCEGKNGCGSVFSRKDALLRHQRIRGHGK